MQIRGWLNFGSGFGIGAKMAAKLSFDVVSISMGSTVASFSFGQTSSVVWGSVTETDPMLAASFALYHPSLPHSLERNRQPCLFVLCHNHVIYQPWWQLQCLQNQQRLTVDCRPLFNAVITLITWSTVLMLTCSETLATCVPVMLVSRYCFWWYLSVCVCTSVCPHKISKTAT